MVAHSCIHLPVAAPCSLQSSRPIITTKNSLVNNHGWQAAPPAARSRTVCFHSTGECSDTKEQEEGAVQHARPIENYDSAFGPRGMLLAGFCQEDAKKTVEWMQEMEADFKVSHVVDDMVTEPLGEALYSPDSQEMRVEPWQQTRTLCPRICIMSGLTGEEQIAVAESWEDFAGSPAPFFAAAVPKSLGENLKTILQAPVSVSLRGWRISVDTFHQQDSGMQAIVDENANNRKDDPRLDPSNFLSTVDMAKLRAQVQEKLRQRGVKPPGEEQTSSQGSDDAAGDSTDDKGPKETVSKGFGSR